MTLKERIIDAALDLFAEKGFDQTTIENIIKKAKTSKGGFYHHFKSKNEILDNILDKQINDLRSYFDKIFDNVNQDVIKMFNGLMRSVHEFSRDYMYIWPKMVRVFAFEGNLVITQRVTKQIHEITAEYYSRLIKLGNEKGLFHVKNPEHISTMWTREMYNIYHVMSELGLGVSKYTYKDLLNLLKFDEDLLHYLLDAKSNTIDVYNEGIKYYEYTKTEIDKFFKQEPDLKELAIEHVKNQ